MGTRTNIIIRIPEYTKTMNYTRPDGSYATRHMEEQKIILYRHWDGYPSETGADLVWLMDALQRWDVRAFPNVLCITDTLFALSTHRKLQYRMIAGAAQLSSSRYQSYEKTDSIHGDIEYLYELTYIPNTYIVNQDLVRQETTLEIKERVWGGSELVFNTIRTINLTSPLPSEEDFNKYIIPVEGYDNPYSFIAEGDEIAPQVVIN